MGLLDTISTSTQRDLIQADFAKKAEDIAQEARSTGIFRETAKLVLAFFAPNLEQHEAISIYLAGVEAGKFCRREHVGEGIGAYKNLEKLSTTHPALVLGKNAELISKNPRISIENIDEVYCLLALELSHSGESYGRILAFAKKPISFESERRQALRNITMFLGELLGDSLYIARIGKLSSPFFESFRKTDRLPDLYRQISSDAAFLFGADAVVLRKRTSSHRLEVVDHLGSIHAEQLEQGSFPESLCRDVMLSKEHQAWTSYSRDAGGNVVNLGIKLPDSALQELVKINIHSCIIAKLEGANDEALGTLAILHSRTHQYSARDTNLFWSYCTKCSDGLVMAEQYLRQQELIGELEQQHELVEKMNYNLLRAEVISLLGHDWGNKVLNQRIALERAEPQIKKAIRQRSWQVVEDDWNSVVASWEELDRSASNLSSLATGSNELPSKFSVHEMIENVYKTVKPSLDRINVFIDYSSIDPSIEIVSKPGVISQILYNLITNTRDAQKSRGKFRANIMKISFQYSNRVDKRSICTFRISDNGPGINRRFFPDPKKIFDLGASSDPDRQGSGLGLSICRDICQKLLHGSLELEDSSIALFELRFPEEAIPNPKK